MLIYLFALEQSGTERYGGPLRPAGVLYVPAHDDMQRFPDRPEDDAKIDGEVHCAGGGESAYVPGGGHVQSPGQSL